MTSTRAKVGAPLGEESPNDLSHACRNVPRPEDQSATEGEVGVVHVFLDHADEEEVIMDAGSPGLTREYSLFPSKTPKAAKDRKKKMLRTSTGSKTCSSIAAAALVSPPPSPSRSNGKRKQKQPSSASETHIDMPPPRLSNSRSFSPGSGCTTTVNPLRPLAPKMTRDPTFSDFFRPTQPGAAPAEQTASAPSSPKTRKGHGDKPKTLKGITLKLKQLAQKEQRWKERERERSASSPERILSSSMRISSSLNTSPIASPAMRTSLREISCVRLSVVLLSESETSCTDATSSSSHMLPYDQANTVNEFLTAASDRIVALKDCAAATKSFYRLYNTDTGECMDDEMKCLSEYGFTGWEVACTYKPIPIPLRIFETTSGRTRTLSAQELTSGSCAELLSTLWEVSPFPGLIGQSSDYSLFVPTPSPSSSSPSSLPSSSPSPESPSSPSLLSPTRSPASVSPGADTTAPSTDLLDSMGTPPQAGTIAAAFAAVGGNVDASASKLWASADLTLSPGQSHLHDTIDGEWLVNERPLGSYVRLLALSRINCPSRGSGDAMVTLELRKTPTCLHVTNEIHAIPIASMMLRVGDLVALACKQKDIAEATAECYGFYQTLLSRTDDGQDKVWLDSNHTLATSGLRFHESVTLAERPTPVTVTSVDGVDHVIDLVFIVPVSEVIDVICGRLALDQTEKSYSLRGGSTRDLENELPLFHWGTLHEQHVPLTGGCIRILEQDGNAEIEVDGETRLDSKDIWNTEVWEEEGLPEGVKEEHLGHVGTLNALVIQLTSPKIDPNYMKNFLSTYRSFTTPALLFKKLAARYQVPDDHAESDKFIIQMRVLTTIKYWVETEYEDLGAQLEQISQMIDKALVDSEGSRISQVVTGVKTALVRMKNGGNEYIYSGTAPAPKMPKHLTAITPILDIDSLEVARQLTKGMVEPYSKLKMTEFFHQCWSKESTQHQCPNLMTLINHFNQTASFVPSLILAQRTLKERVKHMVMLINVAQHLKELNNFHTLTAIISGLANSAVQRLKHTRAKLPKKSNQILAELEELTTMQGNYKAMRDHLADVMPPCIPYLGLYLADITFIDDGNPDLVGNLINFEKRKMLYKVVTIIVDFQSERHNLVAVPSILRVISATAKHDDKSLYAISLAAEPRGAAKGDID
eukprot:TRINITY_DN8699_c0_g1_i1.p1 TRINITY_DN8699_c0_g1~~TRINITY_DN8699_c0_g1_i1.p1  ORF type:complete len:1154 (-),score=234.84 TRINITY_DN8699_c0_g1_i1:170-3631(-)